MINDLNDTDDEGKHFLLDQGLNFNNKGFFLIY